LPLAAKAQRPVVDGGVVSPTGEVVVIVEDQEDNRMLLAEILAGEGYRVLAAADGREAIELIRRHQPPIALVDIGLPVLSGYDIACEVRMRMGRSDIFLVALTGYGQQQDRDAVLQAGFDQHLVKPVDVSTLLEVLRMRRTLRRGAQIASA
jgi:two-component system CheB/CheR fusion protein